MTRNYETQDSARRQVEVEATYVVAGLLEQTFVDVHGPCMGLPNVKLMMSSINHLESSM